MHEFTPCSVAGRLKPSGTASDPEVLRLLGAPAPRDLGVPLLRRPRHRRGRGDSDRRAERGSSPSWAVALPSCLLFGSSRAVDEVSLAHPDQISHFAMPMNRRSGRTSVRLSGRVRGMNSGRSYEAITTDDLARLGDIAAVDRERFFKRRPEYRDRLLCSALCQGAGLHYVEVAAGKAETNGIKDFDVWSFFSAIPGERFPADRRRTYVDLGKSKFGRWDGEAKVCQHFKGRRVDLLVRALPVPVDADPVSALRSYLAAARTGSAKFLAKKGVVLIDPLDRRGKIVWPREQSSHGPISGPQASPWDGS